MARAPRDFAADSRIVPLILRALERRGLEVDRVLRVLDLPSDARHLQEVPLTPADFEALLSSAAAELDDPLIALRLPGELESPSYNVGELAAQASPSLAEALERVARYASLFYAHLSFHVERRSRELWFTQRLRGGRRGRRYGNEYGIGSALHHARKVAGSGLAPLRVWFAHPRPPEAEAIARWLGARVEFDADDNGIAFALEDADRHLPNRDPRLLRTAEELAERALAERPPEIDFPIEVAQAIRRGLPEGRVEAAAIARRMRLSTRTLQRRLEQTGTTYSALLERARRELAVELVETTREPLAEIAERAGFSDAATFSRAFKRWTGASPGAFRKQRDPGI